MRSLEPLAEQLRAVDRLLIATHSAPDGDGIGCQLALLAALEPLGKQVSLICSGEIPRRFLFLPGAERLQDWDALTPGARDALLSAIDLVLIVDTHERELTGALAPILADAQLPILFLDHHPLSGPAEPQVFCDPGASSAGEVCWHLLGQLGSAVTPAIATCLYTAIAYDTNMFRYLRGRAETHRIAADLIEHGADADRIYRQAFASASPGKASILGELLRSFRLEADGRIAHGAISLEMIARCGATRDELRDLIVPLLEIERVEVALLFKERSDGLYKVSLRSKGRYAVDGIAAEFGGGGHAFAAGAHLAGPLADAVGRMIARLQTALENDPLCDS